MGWHHSEQWLDNRRRHATKRCHQRRKEESIRKRAPRHTFKSGSPSPDESPSGVSITGKHGQRTDVSGKALDELDDRIMNAITGSEFDRKWEEYHRKHPSITKDEYVGELTRQIITEYADQQIKQQKELKKQVEDAQETAKASAVISMQATGSMADAYDELVETHQRETNARNVAYTSWVQSTAEHERSGSGHSRQSSGNASSTASGTPGRVMSNPRFNNVIKSMRSEALSKSLRNVQRRISQLQMVLSQMKERGNPRGAEVMERNIQRLRYQEQHVSDMIDKMR